MTDIRKCCPLVVALLMVLFAAKAQAQPSISSFTPSSGAVGSVITISGSNFSGATGVTVGGKAGLIVSNSATSIQAYVMPGSTTGAIAVTTSGGTANSGSNFTVSSTLYPQGQRGNSFTGTGISGGGFGGSVRVSADGSTAIVANVSDNGWNGAVWIFTRSGTTWTQQGSKITPSDAVGSGTHFGSGLGISADGSTVIIGGNGDNSSLGAAWVYVKSGSSWVEQTKLIGTGYSGSSPSEGAAVGISADGNTAFLTGQNDNSNSGAVWVFTRSGTTWSQQGSKLPSNYSNASMGSSGAMSADGKTIVVGSIGYSSNQGGAYIFVNSSGTWSKQTVLNSSDGFYAGNSVAISADGNTVSVGCNNTNNYDGLTYIYTRSGSTWSKQATLTAAVGTGSLYGTAVALSADGNTLLSSADVYNSQQGTVYVSTRSGSTWTQQTQLLGTGSYSGSPGSQFGSGVGISADGQFAVVGASFQNSGAAWTFNNQLPDYAWTGSVSSDWSNANNWSFNTPPTSTNTAIINSSASTQPVLSTNATIGGLTFLGTTPYLYLNGHTLTVNGIVSGKGYFSGSSTSSLAMHGNNNYTIYFDPTAHALQNFIMDIGVANNGYNLTIGNSLDLYGVLTPASGNLITNGYLTLKSTSIAKTGILGTFYPGTSKINGNVTIERYIPAGYRGYRDIAPQTYGPSIYNSWQEGGSATAGYGTFITGRSAVESKSSFQGSPTSANPSPNSSGLDYSINGMPSAFTYNGTGFDTITNTTTTTLDAYKGYRVLIRGDRNFNLFNTPIVGAGSNLLMHDPTILRATGPIVTYNVVYSNSNVQNWYTGTDNSVKLNNNKNGFTMIANPYPCPVLWGDGTSSSGSNTNTVYGASGGSGSHLNASYWYLDPTYGSTGRYKAFNALTGSSAHVYYGSSGDSLYLSLASGGYIQPGQAFFVQTQSSGPSLTFTESTKAPSSSLVSLFGTQTQEKQSKIYVGISNGSVTLDEVAIAFGKGYSNVFGAQDAVKIKSESDNIYISDKGQQLSIDGRLPATESDVLPVELEKLSSASNKLQIDATNYIDNGFVPVLKDNYKGTTTALLLGLNAIEFSTDSLVPASYANRFSITFTPSALAINSIVASATLNNKIATITWNTVGEKGESYFEVEKSSDGNNFVSIGKQAAKNTASASYKSTDNDVVATTSYYRIKAVSETGAVNYSNVAKLQLAVNSLQFTVYPNPLVGKTLNVLLSNVNAGKYVVSIYNVLGEKVNEQTISHNGGSATHGVVISNTLSAGMYSVVIREAASNQIVHQTSLTINH